MSVSVAAISLQFCDNRQMGTDVEQISAEFARHWWKTLMANAVSLIEDAAVLAAHESPGRARSLVVLAMEELAKARWLYQAAQGEWTAPLELYDQAPSAAQPIDVPEGLRGTRWPHAEKLQVAEQFASGLGGFWDPARRFEYYDLPDLKAFEKTAKQRNLDKQAGFYVDRSGDTVTSPLQVPGNGVVEDIRRAAKVIQMHLIEDHTRQQDSLDRALIDSAEDLHWAVMPYSDPDLFADFEERYAGGEGASDLSG
jgi:AbiV family abortive infection protein